MVFYGEPRIFLPSCKYADHDIIALDQPLFAELSHACRNRARCHFAIKAIQAHYRHAVAHFFVTNLHNDTVGEIQRAQCLGNVGWLAYLDRSGVRLWPVGSWAPS